jgi:hypothetical protein
MLKVKNWEKYQHYRDRCPPWIKLDTRTFQDYDFACLQDASKLLALCIWTLASRSKDGSVPADFAWMKSQCGLGDFVKIENLKELIDKGFILDASKMLASCKQSARPETETETETETEGEREADVNNLTIENKSSLFTPFLKNETALNEIENKKPSEEKKTKTERGQRLKKFLEGAGEKETAQLWGEWALKAGLSGAEINAQMQVFCDYWNARAGSGGTKLDWFGTWRNWVRRQLAQKQQEETRNAIRNNYRR